MPSNVSTKPLLHRLQAQLWSIAITVLQPAKQGYCKCMVVKQIVRCFAISMNLLSNFNEFTQQFQWIYSAISMNLLGNFNVFALPSRRDSCTKELLHVSNESRSSHQNNLPSKSFYFESESTFSLYFIKFTTFMYFDTICGWYWWRLSQAFPFS